MSHFMSTWRPIYHLLISSIFWRLSISSLLLIMVYLPASVSYLYIVLNYASIIIKWVCIQKYILAMRIIHILHLLSREAYAQMPAQIGMLLKSMVGSRRNDAYFLMITTSSTGMVIIVAHRKQDITLYR